MPITPPPLPEGLEVQQTDITLEGTLYQDIAQWIEKIHTDLEKILEIIYAPTMHSKRSNKRRRALIPKSEQQYPSLTITDGLSSLHHLFSLYNGTNENPVEIAGIERILSDTQTSAEISETYGLSKVEMTPSGIRNFFGICIAYFMAKHNEFLEA